MTQDNDSQSSGPDDTGATEPRPDAEAPQAPEPVQLGKPDRPEPEAPEPPPAATPPPPAFSPPPAFPPPPDYPPVPDYPPAPDYPPPPPFGDSNGTPPPPSYPPATYLEPPYTYDQPPPGSAPYGSPSYGSPGYSPSAGGVPPAFDTSPGHPAASPGWTVRSAEASSLRTQAIVSLVLNLLAVVACCNLLAIGGAVCAGSAIGKVDNDYARARSLVRWSWGLFAGGFALAVLGFIGLVTLGYLSDATTG